MPKIVWIILTVCISLEQKEPNKNWTACEIFGSKREAVLAFRIPTAFDKRFNCNSAIYRASSMTVTSEELKGDK